MLLSKVAWALEERFGGYGEELGVVLRGIAVQDRCAAAPGAPDQRVELGGDHLDPPLVGGVIRQAGTAAEIRATSDPVVRQFIEGRPDLEEPAPAVRRSVS